MSRNVVPAGKKIIIRDKNTASICKTDLILEEDITITLSSNFESLFGDSGNDLLTHAGSLFRDLSGGSVGFSGKFKQFAIQTWKGTDPVSFKASLSFHQGYMGWWNAQTEVYDPIQKLMKIPLPGESVAGNLVPPGPSILQVVKDSGVNVDSGERYSLQIGQLFYFPSVVIKVAQPTFSNETDEFGIPISAKIELDFITTTTATKKSVSFRPSPGSLIR